MYILKGNSLEKAGWFQPESMSLTLAEKDSQATVTIPEGAAEVALGTWLMDETDPGGGVIWRVKSTEDTYNADTAQLTLEHVIQTLNDDLIFGEVTPADMTRNAKAESISARAAVAYALGKQKHWKLGDFEFDQSGAYKFNGDSVMEAVETVCGTLDKCWWDYDLSSYPFTLHIRKQKEDVTCEMRAGRNLQSIKQTINRSGMYTRFYPIGENNLHITGDYVSRNEEIWGIISETETDQTKQDEDMLRKWAENRLANHCEPGVTIQISGLDLSESTGEALDHITIGTRCRVPLPQYKTTIIERVVKMRWRDKIREPENVTITLANTPVDVSSILKEEKIKSGRSGRAAAKKAEEDHAWFEDTTEHVAMVAEAIIGIDEDGVDWSRVASIRVDGEGIHQWVKQAQDDIVTNATHIEMNEQAIQLEAVNRENADNTLSGRITINANAITQEVTRATGAEETLGGRITVTAEAIVQEVQDRTSADNIMSARITANTSAITAEVTRATGEEETLAGRIKVTADAITQEVTDRTNGDELLSGRITTNANAISAEVTRATGAEESLSGRITIAADAITQEVTNRTNADNALSGRITTTAEAITEEVTRAKGAEESLSGRITATAESITAEVTRAKGAEETLAGRVTVTESSIIQEVTDRTNADSALSGRITTNANAITAEVTRAMGAEETLSGRITVNANKVALVVDSSNNIKAASIVAAINDGDSSVVISADHITLDGTTKINDVMTIYNQYVSITKPILVSSVVADELYVGGVANLKALSEGVYDLRITQSGNTYTLQKQTNGGGVDWTDIGTFSRATSLSGGWSGGVFTVTASPQGNSYTTSLYSIESNGDPSIYSGSDKYMRVPLKVTYDPGDGEGVDTGFGETILVNATPCYNKGWAAAYGKVSLPAVSSATNASVNVVVPISTVGDSETHTYTLSEDNSWVYLKEGGNVVARIANDAYGVSQSEISFTSDGVITDTSNRTKVLSAWNAYNPNENIGFHITVHGTTKYYYFSCPR